MISKISFGQLFRLIFVFFSLYLLGDAFYRWDGYSYYGSFSGFLPALALASILWSIIAMLTTMLLWLPLRAFEWFCQRVGWKSAAEHLFLYAVVFILFVIVTIIIWKIKILIWPYMHTTFQLKLMVFLVVALMFIFLTWLMHNRLERWENIVNERITPLVWLLGMFVIISVPLVAYQTWFKNSDHAKKVKSLEVIEYSKTDKSRPNIILVTFDALTARNMSVYGYSRPTTPFINKWAKEASVFTRAEAESNFTAPTTASLMTGKRVWTHRRYSLMPDSMPVRIDIGSLPQLLKKNGYFNMAFITNPIATVKKLGVSDYFDIAPDAYDLWKIDNIGFMMEDFLFRVFGDKIKLYSWLLQDDFIFGKLINRFKKDTTSTSYPPEIAFNKFINALNNNRQEPYFAWIHLNPPHTPYLPPEPYKGMFDSSVKMRTNKSFNTELIKIREFLSQYGRFPEETKTLRARYDEFIRYCDNEFEKFIKHLTEKNKLKNVVIILSSDHGEIFNHNSLAHGSSLYESETNIPLIIKEPNQVDGKIINNLVEQIDIPVTILELANIPVPTWMEGSSLVPLLHNINTPSKAAFSMNLLSNDNEYPITKGIIAVWEREYKLIHYLEKKKSLLFNLNQDPEEQDNLINKKPEIGRHLLDLIQDNLNKANEKIIKNR